MNLREIKSEAKKSMKMKYGFAILATILWNLVSIGSFSVGLIIGAILVGGALTASRAAFYLDIANDEFKGTDNIYRGFKMFARALGIIWRIILAVIIRIIIWAIILLICGNILSSISSTFEKNIPGYIVAVLYFIYVVSFLIYFVRYFITVYLSFHILVDNENQSLSAKECIKLSKKHTKGKIFNIFLFELSFILWRFGVIVTLGTLNLYFAPYFNTAKAKLYLQLKN